jgi:hypothetical protein
MRSPALPLALAAGLLVGSTIVSPSCSSPAGGGAPASGGAGSAPAGMAGASAGQAGDTGGTAGASPAAGAAGGGPSAVAGASGTAGAGGASVTGAGDAAVGMSGDAGVAGASGAAGGGLEPGDTPPWRALHVTATVGLHVHGNAGVDTRAKSLGKLGINLGVSSGGYSSWLGRHGYHVMGASFGECDAPNLGAGRDAVGTCRLGEWAMVKQQVESGLTSLAKQYPEEDWGYFLNQDGSVRWSDVAFTGVSHGATTAAVIARLGVRVWRAVSCAGPRDDTCGVGAAPGGTFDPNTPPYDPSCPVAKIASWLDMPSMTPMDRFYGLVGTTDVEYGDIMFNMERTMYPGKPVQWNVAGAVLTGTNRFVSTEGGHLDFLNAADDVKPMNTDAVLNIAFGIPPENQNPNF